MNDFLFGIQMSMLCITAAAPKTRSFAWTSDNQSDKADDGRSLYSVLIYFQVQDYDLMCIKLSKVLV